MKKLLADKKIDSRIVAAVLYLSFCAAEYFTFRGTYVALLSNMEFKNVALSNYIVAFFLAGVVPFALYELIASFMFRAMQVRVGPTETLLYALRYFYIGANLVIFLVKLLYLWYPIAHIYGDIVIDFVITAGFFAGFLWYAAKRVPKERIAPLLYQLGSAYIMIYGVIALIRLLTEVL